MRRALISPANPVLGNVLGFAVLVVVMPLFLVAKLLIMPFERPMKRSPQEVAQYLRGFLNETGGDWDWDDFISIAIADPILEDIRARAANLDLPMADTDTQPLKALVAEAEALAAAQSEVS
ncbi:hypothetical protein [Sphingomonas sp.]|jgi:hypothetical protein|uniref:hypothetical protein n=1 Tax=Sphingomonas sp. TaxID=28214 RepID=UPI00261D1467|nr:hypothetical protein [Sphingomonas sp.]MDF2602938.1 hypothetical protein [Sphingomonas sp.]